jgi:hypothetical protein
MAAFSRYIGIDYSGAETPESSLKGLRVSVINHFDGPLIEFDDGPRSHRAA